MAHVGPVEDKKGKLEGKQERTSVNPSFRG